jgi:hypothetical protein
MKRYMMVSETDDGDSWMDEDDEGDYVLYSDLAALEAERDALRAENERKAKEIRDAHNALFGFGGQKVTLVERINQTVMETTALREVRDKAERLVKAVRARQSPEYLDQWDVPATEMDAALARARAAGEGR